MRQVSPAASVPASVSRYLLPHERSVIAVRKYPAELAGPLILVFGGLVAAGELTRRSVRPKIVWGASLIIPIMVRFPILGVGGGALLGWIAGEMIAEDRWVGPFLNGRGFEPTAVAGLSAVIVLVIAILVLRARAKKKAD